MSIFLAYLHYFLPLVVSRDYTHTLLDLDHSCMVVISTFRGRDQLASFLWHNLSLACVFLTIVNHDAVRRDVGD